jgi:hypothetical protein
MSTRSELLRELRKNGNLTVLEELRNNNFLSADSRRTFGVEIECIFPTQESIRAFIDDVNSNSSVEIREEGYNHATRPHWKLVTDSSVRATTKPGVGREVVSPILKGAAGKKQLKVILETLKAHGVYVNKTCGIHVHFGAKDFKIADFRRIVQLYKNHEDEIDQMVSKSRRGDRNRYCGTLRHVSDIDIANANSVSALDRIIGGRYHKLNLASFVRHGTVEFRQHQGSIEYGKISQWIDFGMCMMRWARYSKVDVNAPLFDGCEFSKEACNFWAARRLQLNAA